MSTTVAVVGARGYGRNHLQALDALCTQGRTELVGVVDPAGVDGIEEVPASVPVFETLGDLLEVTVPQIAVISTPIHTHLPLARQAMLAGSHVLVEKPTTATLAEFNELLEVSTSTARACQVGFQSFGSHALPEIARRITSGQIGDLLRIGGIGTWIRSTAYYERAPWAGRRRMDGREVVDGVVTNPLAHAVATGLRIAGALRVDDVEEVVVDLFHAHEIESDDTSAVRILTVGGLSLTFGLTLAAGTAAAPRVIVYGGAGELELHYNEDSLTARIDGHEDEQFDFGRVGLLSNLVDHLQTGVPLVAALDSTGAFMRVMEAVRTASDPVGIDSTHVTWVEDDLGVHPVVTDVELWCERVASSGRTFTELGAPWTRSDDDPTPTGPGE